MTDQTEQTEQHEEQVFSSKQKISSEISVSFFRRPLPASKTLQMHTPCQDFLRIHPSFEDLQGMAPACGKSPSVVNFNAHFQDGEVHTSARFCLSLQKITTANPQSKILARVPILRTRDPQNKYFGINETSLFQFS